MIEAKRKSALEAEQAVARVKASLSMREILGQSIASVDVDERKFAHPAIKTESENDEDDFLDNGILSLLEDATFDDPWAMAAAMPELPRFDDSLLNEDESSPNYDPRPAIAEVTEDDWDPDLVPIFTVLKKMIRQAVNVNTKPGPREKALRWVFQPNLPGPHGLDFGSACAVFGTRPFVIQARTLHQLWVSNIPLRRPLPDGADSLPMCLQSEIRTRMGSEALPAARMIWDWPGIRADILMEQLSTPYPLSKTLDRVLLNLEENGYIACSTGFWYFTSRNFNTMTPAYRRAFSWGPSFYGET